MAPGSPLRRVNTILAASILLGLTGYALAQPPLLPRMPLKLIRDDGAYSPVELAIRLALG